MADYEWIKPAEHHKWELGCRTCQREAEERSDLLHSYLLAIFVAASRHPIDLYETIEEVKNSLKN